MDPEVKISPPGTAAVFSIALLALAVAAAPCSVAETGEGRISCFLLGSIQSNICPLQNYFTEDPLFTYQSDPQQAGLSLDERRRLDRLYFPRSRQLLLERFDMVFVSDPRLEHFTSKQFGDLYHAFTVAGMPSFWAFGPSYGDICVTMLDDVLPIGDYDGYYHRPWRVKFDQNREPLFTPFIALGMENVPGEAYGWMAPRVGSVVWADMVPYGYPWMVSWRPGSSGGLSWVCADEFNMVWWALTTETRGMNPYAIDLMTNLILYSLDQPLISDIFLRHEARHQLSIYGTVKLTILSMLEWADNFGANTLPLSREITEADAGLPEAFAKYLEQDYVGTTAMMSTMIEGLNALGLRAVELKDEALFWVFLSEWLAVTAAAMMAATLSWSLMVKRRMYRPVGTTRVSETW